MFGRSAAVVGLFLLGGPTLPQPLAAPAAAAAPAAQSAVRPMPPPTASYAITARLDPASRTVTGDELLTWRNSSRVAATSLRFHLYYNAWRSDKSTWMRERALTSELPPRPDADRGWIDVTSLRVIAGGAAPVDATARMRFIAPDDGNLDDHTVVEVPLDSAVAPGGTINVQIAWSSRVPRPVARTGAIGQFYFLAQWFPKIGVLEDAGWNCHQFHRTTEFFADFGTYDVKLTVPRGWTVGATGVERERRDEADGTTTHHYAQDGVHDFAWTTSPDYVERKARFEHASLPPVEMRLLLQPEHVGQAERHFDATRVALKYYGEWYGAYPYGHITIIDPAWQSGADGMEYPTLFTAGTRWIAPQGVTDPEDVVVHEAGHQFWYGIVATNEFEHAWMDEGFNTYSEARAVAQAYTPNYFSQRYFGGFVPWVFRDLPLTRETDGDRLDSYRAAATGDDPSTASWRYWPGTAGAITYSKTALWLNTLERMVGPDMMNRILSTYFNRFAFTHPTPQDFFAVANQVSGQDLTWFFDQVYRSSNVFDYGIDTFHSERAPPAASQAASQSGTAPRLYRTTIAVRRYGDAIFPVDVQVVFENKETVRWRWDGRDRWKLFQVDRPVAAASVQVDPDHVLLLDVNSTNNSATRHPAAAAAARKWSLAWLIWLQDHLLTYGFFA